MYSSVTKDSLSEWFASWCQVAPSLVSRRSFRGMESSRVWNVPGREKCLGYGTSGPGSCSSEGYIGASREKVKLSEYMPASLVQCSLRLLQG